MRTFLLHFFILLSFIASAQSTQEIDFITGDDLRGMISEIFESPEGETFHKAYIENGQELLFFVHTFSGNAATNTDRRDIREAIIDLKNNLYDLDIAFGVQIIDENEKSILSQMDLSRGIQLSVSRRENKIIVFLRRSNAAQKKSYELSSLFHKTTDGWEILSQSLNTQP